MRSGEGTTVGIVAFSVAQRDMILEVLDQMRREDQNLSDFLNAEGSDALFVKNIENVQGDERDVILISLGYGPIAVGQRLTSMNFGPVNREGGERRLNVLFTRAKLRTEVFLSFDWRDIDLSRASGPGVSALKDYLEFAATGRQSTHILTGEDFDSDFEQDVAEVIHALGYKVSPQVGDQGFRIDLGVHHPEQGDRFMLAVECDGATYHSALSARERDYHRQKLLESRGWVFHRIWSTDWFYRRSDTIQALRQALSKAVEDQAAKHAARPFAYSAPPHALETQPTPQLGLAQQAPSAATRVLSLPYVTADLPSQVGRELLELGPSALAPLIKAVVTTEGPVHQDEIYRRIIHSFGLKKLGSRLHAHLDKAFKGFRRSDATVREASGFVWFDEQLDGLTPRDRSEAQPSIQRAPMIADAEIKEALAIVARENGDLEHDDRVRAVAALFGFKRTGTELSARITEVIVKTL